MRRVFFISNYPWVFIYLFIYFISPRIFLLFSSTHNYYKASNIKVIRVTDYFRFHLDATASSSIIYIHICVCKIYSNKHTYIQYTHTLHSDNLMSSVIMHAENILLFILLLLFFFFLFLPFTIDSICREKLTRAESRVHIRIQIYIYICIGGKKNIYKKRICATRLSLRRLPTMRPFYLCNDIFGHGGASRLQCASTP